MADWIQVAEIGVDAGLIWVGDPSYSMTHDTPFAFGPTWQDFVAMIFAKINQGIARFEKDDGWGDIGVAIESGMGDDIYPVYVRRDVATGRVAEVRVVFLPEDDGP